MAYPDTLCIANALEDAGMTSEEARAAALRLRAGTRPEPPGYLLDINSRHLRNELIEAIAGAAKRMEDAEENILERIQAGDRRQTDAVRRHLDAVEYRTSQHLARHERRIARLVWKLFAALVAVLAASVAAVLYLP